MLEIFDGSGVHLSSYNAMKMCLDSKIFSLKKKGGSLHVNQAYGKFVAKGDKAAKRDSLTMQQLMTNGSGVVDQWQLIHTDCMQSVAKQETWTNSFSTCNLDPHT